MSILVVVSIVFCIVSVLLWAFIHGADVLQNKNFSEEVEYNEYRTWASNHRK